MSKIRTSMSITVMGFREISDGASGHTVSAAGRDQNGKRAEAKMSKKLAMLDIRVGDTIVGEARLSTSEKYEGEGVLVDWANVSLIKGVVRGESFFDNQYGSWMAYCYGWSVA